MLLNLVLVQATTARRILNLEFSIIQGILVLGYFFLAQCTYGCCLSTCTVVTMVPCIQIMVTFCENPGDSTCSWCVMDDACSWCSMGCLETPTTCTAVLYIWSRGNHGRWESYILMKNPLFNFASNGQIKRACCSGNCQTLNYQTRARAPRAHDA